MVIEFRWAGRQDSLDPIRCELSDVPRYEELVYLTFPGHDEHGFRVLWVRWYPQALPPRVAVFVTAH